MAEEGGRETFWDVCSHFELGAMTGEQCANMQGAISEEWSDALSPTTLLTCLVGSTRVVGASRQQAARGPTRRECDGGSRKERVGSSKDQVLFGVGPLHKETKRR